MVESVLVQASGAARRRPRLHESDDNDDNDGQDDDAERKQGSLHGGTIEIDDNGESHWQPQQTLSDTEGSQGNFLMLMLVQLSALASLWDIMPALAIGPLISYASFCSCRASAPIAAGCS